MKLGNKNIDLRENKELSQNDKKTINNEELLSLLLKVSTLFVIIIIIGLIVINIAIFLK